MDENKAVRDEKASKAGEQLSKLGAAKGGEARAKKLSPERRKEIAQAAIDARWTKAGKATLSRAIYTGELKIGDMVLPCSVLSDGTRILTQNDFMRGMGMYYSGWVSKNQPAEEVAAGVPQFLAFKTLKPYVDKHLGDMQSIILKYRTEQGKVAHGIKADIIPKICDIWLDAEEHEKLGSRQKLIAKKAKLLMRALAHVGIIALVDEATGYQYDRARDELLKILDAYITEELRPWTRMFPEEFFKQTYRLLEWEYRPGVAKRNSNIGKWINKYIYEKLPPGVLPELRRLNPRTNSGYRRHKHFQFLTAETGNVHLDKQITAVTTIMKISDDRDDFEHNFAKAFPRVGDQQRLPLVVEVEPEKKK